MPEISRQGGGPVLRSPNFKIIFAAVLLVSFMTVGFTVAHKDVTITDGNKTKAVSTFAGTVSKLLKQEGITLGAYDAVDPGLETRLEDGATVCIKRGFTVTILVEGSEEKFVTLPAKVKDILAAANITIDDDDIVNPSRDAVLKAENSIQVSRVSTDRVVVQEEIPFKTVREPDRTLAKGINKTKVKGKPGLQENVYEVTFVDGKETERKLVDTKILQEPKDQVVYTGTLQIASRGGVEFSFERAITAVSTAYTYTGRNTYTGTRPKVGTVAVDPRVIPLGTRLYIENYGYGVARDIGSAIVGNRVDVFMESEAAARRWGRRTVKVYILK